MASLLRSLIVDRSAQMDKIIVDAMKDNGIEITSRNYNTILGAAQLFMNTQYIDAAVCLKQGGFKQPSQYHTMLSSIAMKKHACIQDEAYGSKYNV